jgi:phage shock protein PspC (stress-responsive transcriptional regulator)
MSILKSLICRFKLDKDLIRIFIIIKHFCNGKLVELTLL